MSPLLGFGLLSGLSSAVSNGLGFGRDAYKAHNQRQLIDYNRNSQLQYLQEAPQATISGMEQAGLNPMLAYGSPASGVQVGGSASQGQGQGLTSKSGTSSARQVNALLKLIKGIKSL